MGMDYSAGLYCNYHMYTVHGWPMCLDAPLGLHQFRDIKTIEPFRDLEICRHAKK